MLSSDPVLEIRDLSVRFVTSQETVAALNSISLYIGAGESVGLVGESGSGKSVTALALMGLLPANSRATGGIYFQGRDLLTASDSEMRTVRGKTMSMVFQDPGTSLNPVLTILRQVSEVFEHHMGLGRSEARTRSEELLQSVGISDARSRARYPHQYSGGMRQRVMIAMAIACRPVLLIADEPTTALDVTVQAQILELLDDLVKQARSSLLLISHDLGVIAGMTKRVVVMYGGRIVESAPTTELFARPVHPYTVGLLGSVPRLDGPRSHRMVAISGQPSQSGVNSVGCVFASRCPIAVDVCWREAPPLSLVGPDHETACWISSVSPGGGG